MIRSPGRNSTMSVISRQLSMKPLASNSQGMWRCDGVDGIDEVVEPTKEMSSRNTEDIFSGKYFLETKHKKLYVVRVFHISPPQTSVAVAEKLAHPK